MPDGRVDLARAAPRSGAPLPDPSFDLRSHHPALDGRAVQRKHWSGQESRDYVFADAAGYIGRSGEWGGRAEHCSGHRCEQCCAGVANCGDGQWRRRSSAAGGRADGCRYSRTCLARQLCARRFLTCHPPPSKPASPPRSDLHPRSQPLVHSRCPASANFACSPCSHCSDSAR